MKNTILLAAATVLFSAASAQDSNTTGNTGTTGSTTATDTTRKLNAYGSYSTRDSIAAKYKLLPMPAPLTLEKTFPVLGSYQLNTTAGTENLSGTTTGTANSTLGTTGTTSTTSTTDAGTTGTNATGTYDAAVPMVTVTLDSASKGIVWIDGLPQGRMKAYLKKSPATYRIIAQKTGSGTSIPEGTLHFDPQTNIMHVVLGTSYNEADPTGVFALSTGTTSEDNTADVTVKTKSKKNTKNTKVKSKPKFYTATKMVPADQQGQQQQQGTNNSFESGLQQSQQTNTGNQ